jgi:outer membrane lipoprotein-sorting protein
MHTRLFCLAAILICPGLRADELAPLRVALEKQAKHSSVSVDVRQTKRVPALTEEIVQRGHLWMEPGKAFRWELGKPTAQTAVFDGTKVYLIDNAKKTATELETSDRRAKPLLLMLGFGEGASLDGILETFTVSGTNRVDDHFIVSLLPKGNLKRALSSMVMQVNTTTSFPERIEWTQRDGTVVVTEFFPPSLNKPIPAGTFSVKRDGYRWE